MSVQLGASQRQELSHEHDRQLQSDASQLQAKSASRSLSPAEHPPVLSQPTSMPLGAHHAQSAQLLQAHSRSQSPAVRSQADQQPQMPSVHRSVPPTQPLLLQHPNSRSSSPAEHSRLSHQLPRQSNSRALSPAGVSHSGQQPTQGSVSKSVDHTAPAHQGRLAPDQHGRSRSTSLPPTDPSDLMQDQQRQMSGKSVPPTAQSKAVLDPRSRSSSRSWSPAPPQQAASRSHSPAQQHPGMLGSGPSASSTVPRSQPAKKYKVIGAVGSLGLGPYRKFRLVEGPDGEPKHHPDDIAKNRRQAPQANQHKARPLPANEAPVSPLPTAVAPMSMQEPAANQPMLPRLASSSHLQVTSDSQQHSPQALTAAAQLSSAAFGRQLSHPQSAAQQTNAAANSTAAGSSGQTQLWPPQNPAGLMQQPSVLEQPQSRGGQGEYHAGQSDAGGSGIQAAPASSANVVLQMQQQHTMPQYQHPQHQQQQRWPVQHPLLLARGSQMPAPVMQQASAGNCLLHFLS